MTGALAEIVTSFALAFTLAVIAIAAMCSWAANR